MAHVEESTIVSTPVSSPSDDLSFVSAVMNLQRLWRGNHIREKMETTKQHAINKIIIGETQELKSLMKANPWVKNISSPSTGWTLLMTAIMYKRFFIAQYLISQNCCMSKMVRGRTALSMSMKSGQFDIFTAILAKIEQNVRNDPNVDKQREYEVILRHTQVSFSHNVKDGNTAYEFHIDAILNLIQENFNRKAEKAAEKLKLSLLKKKKKKRSHYACAAYGRDICTSGIF